MRKLTEKEVNDRDIKKIIKMIERLAEKHGSNVRYACQRYAIREQEKSKLEREIKQREEELSQMKKEKGR